jgi:citrate synthase
MAEAVKSSGLRNVVAGESAISTIDGERGILSYRGIDIHELARHSTFEEVVYLLHKGSLPTLEQLNAFRAQLARERPIPDALLSVIRALPRTAHPMTTLRTAVSALGGLDPDANDDGLPAASRKAMRLVAQMATVVAAIDRVRNGRAPVAPDGQLSHAANLLYMLTGERPSDSAARAMDVALILHADHEFNASTFAARVAESLGRSPVSM